MKHPSLVTYPRDKKGKKNNRIHRLIYNTRRWRELRQRVLSKNPLCERCKQEGKIKLSQHVHHIVEISEGYNDSDMVRLGFDYKNLEAICEYHHIIEHKQRKERK